MCLGACLWVGCKNEETPRYEICGIAILLGSSIIIHMTCSMSMIANLVGCNIGDWLYHFKYQYSFRFSRFKTKVKILKIFLILSLESSGFVYGTMDMLDKIVTGVAIVLVQKFMPDLPDPIDVSILYFKWILSFGLGGTFIFSIILWVFLMLQKVGRRYSVYITSKNLNLKS